MKISDNEQLFKHIDSLIDAWCDRRSLKALRHILQGWPLSSGLTDDWHQLLTALKDVRAFARSEITRDESKLLDAIINAVDNIVHRG